MADGDDDDQPQRMNQYDLNSKVMLTAIVSLSVVVVVVALLHIYARFVLRRQARRRAAMQQLRLAVSQAHTATEPPKTGLDPSVIATLPLFAFKRTVCNDDTSAATTTECAVCLSFLEDGEIARNLPNCNHTFHAECIDKWLGSQSTCPICRTEAEPHHLPQLPREAVAGGSTPTAPSLDSVHPTLITVERTSDGGVQTQSSAKIGGGTGSSSRLSSFRKMLSREKSSRRIQSSGQEDGPEDVERQ